MLSRKRHVSKLQSAGDTIVEVLVVLAVVGSALGISYATARRSLLGVRQSQEHAEALQLAQTQLEDIRTAAASSPSPADVALLTPANGILCMSNVTPQDYTGLNDQNYLSNTDCANIDPNGAGYDVSVTYANANGNTPIYTATVTWNDVTGNGMDNVSLVYKVYVP